MVILSYTFLRIALLMIVDAFPGPTIEARSGDTVVVEVVNKLQDNEGVSIHWHGLHMIGSNEMDGAVGFTQCPIPPNRNFTYRFNIDSDQTGTFWYVTQTYLF
jgi:FtsP/CotA-like multicopper oxidase with cupredoxin domain